MNCDCISDIEKKLAERYQAELGVQADVGCQNVGIALVGNHMEMIHLTNFKVTAQAKGYTKGKVVPVHGNYCPICGKSVVKAPEQSGKATASFPCGSLGEPIEETA